MTSASVVRTQRTGDGYAEKWVDCWDGGGMNEINGRVDKWAKWVGEGLYEQGSGYVGGLMNT